MVASPLLLVSEPQFDATLADLIDAYGAKGHPTIRFTSFSSAVRSLDPATCDDITSAHLQAYVYEGLYTYDYLARPVRVVPQLAAKLPTVSDDGLTVTIPIRTGAFYARHRCFGTDADGEPAARPGCCGNCGGACRLSSRTPLPNSTPA